MAQIDVDIQNLMGLKQDLERPSDPRYVYNLRGARVDINSPGACYTMAERVCYSMDVTNRTRDVLHKLIVKNAPVSALRAVAATMIDSIFCTSRTLMRLAALCEMHSVKTTLRSRWMEQNNRRLDVLSTWPDSSGNSYPQYFVEPKDWVKLANSLNQVGIELSSKLAKKTGFSTGGDLQPITVTDEGSYSGQGTMRGLPLVLAPIAAGTAEAGAAAATAAGGSAATAGGAGLVAFLLSPPGLLLVATVVVVGGVWYLCSTGADLADDAGKNQAAGADRMDAARIEANNKITDKIVETVDRHEELVQRAANEPDPAKRKAILEAAEAERKMIAQLQKSVSWTMAKRGGAAQSLFGSDFDITPVLYGIVGVTGLLIAYRLYQNRPIRRELPTEVAHEAGHSAPKELEA